MIVARQDAPSIRGLGWEALPVPALNIRDNTLILGDEIIETPPAVRSRYLETRFLAPLFAKYFDLGARWITGTRPMKAAEMIVDSATSIVMGGYAAALSWRVCFQFQGSNSAIRLAG